MRAFSELVGKRLKWDIQTGSASIPDAGDRHYVLYDGDEPVVQAQVMWERLATFDVMLEAGEGTFQVHMNLADPLRRSVVWKTGLDESAAGFQLATEGIVTANGWINTAGGRKLAWSPTRSPGAEYAIFKPGGPLLMTVMAAFSISIGGDPGRTWIAPEEAADPDLAALAALDFALANEQVLLLHRPSMQMQNQMRDRPFGA